MPVNTYMVTKTKVNKQKPCPECYWYDAYAETKQRLAEDAELIERIYARIDQLKEENAHLKRQLQHCNCNPT